MLERVAYVNEETSHAIALVATSRLRHRHVDRGGSLLGIAKQTLRDIGRTSSVTELAKVLESLEDLVAQTYTATVAQTQDGKVAGTAARILPAEAGHQAVLRLVTAQYPVSAQQIGTTRALPPGS